MSASNFLGLSLIRAYMSPIPSSLRYFGKRLMVQLWNLNFTVLSVVRIEDENIRHTGVGAHPAKRLTNFACTQSVETLLELPSVFYN